MVSNSQLRLYQRARAALDGERYMEAEYLCRQMLKVRRSDPNALTLLRMALVPAFLATLTGVPRVSLSGEVTRPSATSLAWPLC